MGKDRDPYFSKVWKQIEKTFEDWKWRLFTLFYSFCAVAFYVWVARGTDFPEAGEMLLWAAPLLVAFVLKVFIDTHLEIADFVEPDAVGSRECVHLLFDRLRRVARWKHTAAKPICIDVLGVALHHSHEWLENDLKTFMEEFPTVHIELRIAFVDPAVLQTFAFDTEPLDWASESRERALWVQKKLFPYALRSDGRLRLHVRMIQNLPHWHGILVERRYLFLGRVSWTDGTDRFHQRPMRLTCAQNGYRVFSSDDRHQGGDRVSLFRRWIAHYIYGNHGGVTLVDTISPFYGNGPLVTPT